MTKVWKSVAGVAVLAWLAGCATTQPLAVHPGATCAGLAGTKIPASTMAEVGSATVDEIVSIGADVVLVWSLDQEERLETLAASGVPEEIAERFRIYPASRGGLVSDAMTGRRLVAVESAEDYDAHYPALADDRRRIGAESLVALPLRTGRGEVIGAIFAAVNTMYSAVSARAREIATLRALGFGRFPIVVSVLVEAALIGVAGGALGMAIAYLAFNGYETSTMNFQTFSQVAFAFRVTPQLLVMGLVYALMMGLIGGLFPAIRAARLPIPVALREL